MNKFRLYIISLGILLSSVIVANPFNSGVSAAVDSSPDCDNVAIIRCGAFSQRALREKVAQGDVQRVYNTFGIEHNELSGMVNGVVWRDGRVTVNDRVVATGATTAGRNFGGTPIAGTNNAGMYPASRLTAEGETAFVKMTNGRFDFAVIKSCGNPVLAAPTTTTEAETTPGTTATTSDATSVSTSTEPTQVRCDSVSIAHVGQMRYRISAMATATGNADILKYEFSFGDGYGITVDDNSYTYKYKRAGTYEVSVVPRAIINGSEQRIVSTDCVKALTVGRGEKTREAVQGTGTCVDATQDTTPIDHCPTEHAEPTTTAETQTIPRVEACELSTRQVVMIDEGAFNTAMYSRSVDDCETAPRVEAATITRPAPTTVEVCEVSTDDMITIDSSEFDTTKHSYSLSDCRETATILPSTGPRTLAASIIGSSILGYGALTYIQSRRRLINKLLGR